MSRDEPGRDQTSPSQSNEEGGSVLDRIDPVRFGAEITSVKQLMIILGTVMVGMLTAAVGQTVVGPAAPHIIADLDGVEQYAWIFTAFMLSSTVMVPFYGKLSDMYGRRPFFIGGIAVFMIGAVLCGMAQDMTQLIAFRAFQGLGAGAIIPIAIAIVGDIFPPSERGKWQGLLFATFGLATVIGPTLGGWLTDSFGWRWIFYVNLPIGVIAIFAAAMVLPKQTHGERQAIDIWGTLWLIVAILPLLLAITWGGIEYAWTSLAILGLVALSIAGLAMFLWVEYHVENPILNPRFFTNRIYAISVLGGFLAALGMFSTVMYMPLFLQGVLEFSATRSGMLITPMMLGLVFSNILGGQLLSRVGRYKLQAMAGFALAATGMALLSTMDENTSTLAVLRNVIITGVGIGTMMQLFTIVAQNAFSIKELGAITSSTHFFRQMGGVLGVTALGSVLLARFQSAYDSRLTPELVSDVGEEQVATFENPLNLLTQSQQEAGSEGISGMIPEALATAVRESLAIAVTDLYIVGTAVMLLGLVAVFFLPEVPLRTTNRDENEPATDDSTVQPAPEQSAPQRHGAPQVEPRRTFD